MSHSPEFWLGIAGGCTVIGIPAFFAILWLELQRSKRRREP